MKQTLLAVALLALPLILSAESKACYISPHIKCCHPMIGCHSETKADSKR